MGYSKVNGAKADVLLAIHKGCVTRKSIRADTGYHRHTVKKHLEELEDMGCVVREKESVEHGGSRYRYSIGENAVVRWDTWSKLLSMMPIPLVMVFSMLLPLYVSVPLLPDTVVTGGVFGFTLLFYESVKVWRSGEIWTATIFEEEEGRVVESQYDSMFDNMV